MAFNAFPIATAAFTSYRFAATGGSTTRTMPDRLGETYNVKDFGVAGDGSTDDTAAIQAVVDLIANVAFASAPSGTLYFPKGTYKITAPITINNTSVNVIIRFVGEGYNSLLLGDFAGYIIDRSATTGGAQGIIIERLYIKNTHSGADGHCVRLFSTTNISIVDCYIQATGVGLNFFEASYVPVIQGCNISGYGGATGSIGVLCGAGAITGCNITGWDHGIRVSNSGLFVGACRIEVNKVGIMAGMDDDGVDISIGDLAVSGCTMEANDTAIYVHHVSAAALAALSIQGSTGAPSGQSSYGIRVLHSDNVAYIGVSLSGSYDVGGIVFNENPVHSVFVACLVSNSGGGTTWTLPSSTSGMECVRCNNPTLATAYANLPSGIEGMEYDITDSTTATWGATAAGGSTRHVKVRYNGTNWTVVGA